MLVPGAAACGGDDDATDAAVAEAESANQSAAAAVDEAFAAAAGQADAGGGVADSTADAMGTDSVTCIVACRPVTHCMIAGSFTDDGQTITVVRPDGETVCS